MENKDLISARLRELAGRTYQNDYMTHSYFLSASELTDFYASGDVQLYPAIEISLNDYTLLTGSLNHVPFIIYGGWEEAERNVVCFLPSYTDAETFLRDEMASPSVVSCVHIAPVNAKFADELTHRDYLGALMHLGIERERIGDILISHGNSDTNHENPDSGRKDADFNYGNATSGGRGADSGLGNANSGGGAYVFVIAENAQYICSELASAKHTTVMCRIVPPSECRVRPEFELLEGSIASERLDAVLALVYRLARGKAQELVESEAVIVDGRVITSAGYDLKPGMRISVRGHGKFVYEGVSSTTRKGRLYVRVRIYK